MSMQLTGWQFSFCAILLFTGLVFLLYSEDEIDRTAGFYASLRRLKARYFCGMAALKLRDALLKCRRVLGEFKRRFIRWLLRFKSAEICVGLGYIICLHVRRRIRGLSCGIRCVNS